jgi:effector-binding domain-containing protein
VAEKFEPGGRVLAERLAGGLAATILHLGPYTLLHRSYEQIAGWMQRHGHEIAGPPREVFRVGPTEIADPNGYETEVVWPIQ